MRRRGTATPGRSLGGGLDHVRSARTGGLIGQRRQHVLEAAGVARQPCPYRLERVDPATTLFDSIPGVVAESERLVWFAFGGVVVVICAGGGVGNIVPLTQAEARTPRRGR